MKTIYIITTGLDKIKHLGLWGGQMLLNEKEKEALLPDNPSSLTLPLWFVAFGTSLQSDVWHKTSLTCRLIWLHRLCNRISVQIGEQLHTSTWFTVCDVSMQIRLYCRGSDRPQEGDYRCFTYIQYTKTWNLKGGWCPAPTTQSVYIQFMATIIPLFPQAYSISNKMNVGCWRKYVVLKMCRTEDQREILNDLNCIKPFNMKLQLSPL